VFPNTTDVEAGCVVIVGSDAGTGGPGLCAKNHQIKNINAPSKIDRKTAPIIQTHILRPITYAQPKFRLFSFPMYLLMKLATLALLLLAALALYCLICKCSGRENFFGGLDTFTVNWDAPDYVNQSVLTYNWIIVPQSASGIVQTDPTTWSNNTGSVLQGTAAGVTSALVTSAACSSCDFGMPLFFAVQAVDSTVNPTSTSSWAITQITLTGNPNLTATSVTADGNTGGVLSSGSIAFTIAFALSQPAPSTATTQAFINVWTPPTQNSGPGTYITNSLDLSSGVYQGGSFTDSSIWQGSPALPPGPLAYGDVVTTTVMVADSTTVYYYGTTQTTVGGPASLSSPSGITWTISS